MVLRTYVNDNLENIFYFACYLNIKNSRLHQELVFEQATTFLFVTDVKKAKKKELDQRSNEVKENCKSARDTNLTIQEKRIVKVCEMLT